MTTRTFVENQHGSGNYAGYAVWSIAANWSPTGAPVNGDDLGYTAVANAASFDQQADDIANLSLHSLTLSATAASAEAVYVGGNLTLSSLVLNGVGTNKAILQATAGFATQPTVTVNALTVTGPGELFADGKGAVLYDNAASVSGSGTMTYEAGDNALLYLKSAPASTATLTYFGDSGTIALANPGQTISAALSNVEFGDSIELPGKKLDSVTYGSSAMTIVTDTASYTFNHVSYGAASPLGAGVGASAYVDPVTNLLHINFSPDEAQPVTAKTGEDFYRSSVNGNWSQGAAPTSGVAEIGVFGENTPFLIDTPGFAFSLLFQDDSQADHGVDVYVDASGSIEDLSLPYAFQFMVDTELPGSPKSAVVSIADEVEVGGLINGGAAGAAGAGAVLNVGTLQTTNNATFYYVSDSGIVTFAGSLDGPVWLFEAGSGGTFEFKNPSSDIGVILNINFQPGDSIEVPGTHAISVVLDDGLTLTTDAGSYRLSSVVTDGGTFSGIVATHDASSGLEKFTYQANANVVAVIASGTGISNGTGNLAVGSTVTFTVNFSSAITLNTTHGSPTLTLNDGGAASFVSAGASSLTFSYKVLAGQSTPDLQVTTFNLNDSVLLDGANDPVDTSGAVTNPYGTLQIGTVVTVATFNANKAALDAGGNFAISDTAANIVGGLSALEADQAHIGSITATSGTVTASVTTFLADEAALNKVAGGFSIVSPAAGISAYVYTLEADQTHINAITASSGTVTASVAAFTANETVLNKVAGTFAISDTAANITSGLAALEADQTHISSITATGGTVTASVTTFLADKAALDKVAGGFSIVSPAAGISAYIYMLEADQTHINAITATSGTVTASVAAFIANQTVLNKVAGSFAISDTAANITSGLTALQADSAHIGSITATSGTVTASVTTFLADEAALNKVATGFSIVSPAAGISAYVYTLEADQTHINAITSSSGTVTASVAAFIANQTVLNKVAGNFAISDTAANITSGLTALNGDVTHISGVSFTDANPMLTLTQAQATSDASLLARITSAYVENVTGSGSPTPTTTTGHGNGLILTAVAGGHDTLTGNGTSESFVFKPAFGQDIVTDFASHLSGTNDDTITLPSSEFGSFANMMLHDAVQSGSNVILTSATTPTDQLTIDNISIATINAHSADFRFA